MLVTIFIVDIVNSISVHSRTPQEPEDKIVISTYKKKPKQAWIGVLWASVCNALLPLRWFSYEYPKGRLRYGW